MHPYLNAISEGVLKLYPEIEEIHDLEFIGSYDLDFYSLEEIKIYIQQITYKNHELILDKTKLSSKIPENEVVLFFVNKSYILACFDSTYLDTDLKVLDIVPIVNAE